MRCGRSRTDIVPALPSPGSSEVREPLCADDGASVDADARFILSNVTILSLSHRGGYQCMSWPSVGNCGSPIGVARGQVPLCPSGGRNCGVDLSVENVDRPRPDQQRRFVLPAGVPSTSSTGHPRGACRDKAQRRGPASGHDPRVLTPRPSDTAHCARMVTRSLVRPGRRPQDTSGAASICSFSVMPHRYSTGIPPGALGSGGKSCLGCRTCHRTWTAIRRCGCNS
jgi:hypothetical protein